jgi:small subunit ribosomal protein S9
METKKETTKKNVTKKTDEEAKAKTAAKPITDKPKDIKVIANYIRTVGRRKTAVARVRLFKNGKGNIEINGKDWKVYFPTASQQHTVFNPLKITGQTDNMDFMIKVVGGGINSQAEAVRHGISRALLKFNEEFKPSLKRSGFLTRDSRKKERKKPGLKRARRAPQWKKR